VNISELEKAIKATLSVGQQPALAGLAGGTTVTLPEEFNLAARTLASRSAKGSNLLSTVANVWA